MILALIVLYLLGSITSFLLAIIAARKPYPVEVFAMLLFWPLFPLAVLYQTACTIWRQNP